MVDPASIRARMTVVGADGEHVGTVDGVEGDRIKLTRSDSRDGSHHYVPVTQVARVDDRVHLAVPAISAIPGGAGPAAGEDDGRSGMASPLPATLNRAVDGAAPRRNFYLPWIVGAIGVLLLFLVLKSCVDARKHEAAAATETTTVVAETAEGPASGALQGGSGQGGSGQGVSGLGDYLGGTGATPATFFFERLNFDTASSAIRPADRAEVDAVATTLKRYGNARISIAGYADARGSDPANRTLGRARADAVKAALVADGIAADRVATTTGGEGDPIDDNATAGGRAENRRTELVVTAR